MTISKDSNKTKPNITEILLFLSCIDEKYIRTLLKSVTSLDGIGSKFTKPIPVEDDGHRTKVQALNYGV